MLKKLFLICLIGLLGIVSISTAAWSNSLPTGAPWVAQAASSAQPVPSEQSSPDSRQDTVNLPADASTAEPGPASSVSSDEQEQAAPSTRRSQSKPFNPYDMQALKQFDKGSHRAQ